MGRTSIRAVRRLDLQRAAYEVMQERGLTATTTVLVAEKAMMSPALVHRYFRSKDDLLEQAIRYGNARLRSAIVARLLGARGPYERLLAIIDGMFDADYFTEGHARAWVSFASLAPFNANYQRLQKVLYRRLLSNLVHELRELMPDDQAWTFAREIAIVIDGVWLRLAIGVENISRADARHMLLRQLEAGLPITPLGEDEAGSKAGAKTGAML